ncbi:tetrahydrofolate dehydrogenase/cyclohydrolase, catalytic domain protein [Candidatus Endolissoclinum faulkneri L2]|uniref:Bifunctional protein FolD n=1 Tax=Candidatus Endolissoclinum faulkneri L2 TaxID=1193729 RepID=K7YPR6_9PROT|nr:bifunctional 5,10-methylenetetrahydrofolate dehydrogenase/5,10-methenyltetrahydrofolate cyclohydrolase [Candidatus Endolissoclinum faulkneri]AFX98564.1 tetrahydrofolate dehydrogenase/cyclohydrolase, catalytic domain protein [Candidatus Endolissoclinum faulkneri L2]
MMRIKANKIIDSIKIEVKAKVDAYKIKGIKPTIQTIIASDNAAIKPYILSKIKQAANLGIAMKVIELGSNKKHEAFEALIRVSNNDKSIHGIIIDLPIRNDLDQNQVLTIIDQKKDIDGLNPLNQALIQQGQENKTICPAAPQACIKLAETIDLLSGKQVVVIGRGPTVGKPLATMLINRNATVTIVHSRSKNLAHTLRPAKFIFTATGQPGLLNANNVTARHVIIDAGIAYKNDKLVGDFDVEAANKVMAYSSVPGGVGSLTSVIIFSNLLKCMNMQGYF